MEIFEDYALYEGKKISLYQAACIMARAMEMMYRALTVEDGYTHYDLAMSLKNNVVDAWVHEDGENKDA